MILGSVVWACRGICHTAAIKPLKKDGIEPDKMAGV
jgi:hypothetical protein